MHVTRAAAHLDRVRPGWFDEIDCGDLQMASCTRCVLGQIFGSWNVGLKALGYVDAQGYIDCSLILADVSGAFASSVFKDAWIAAIADRKCRSAVPESADAVARSLDLVTV